jgi:hypothetical protein
MQMLKKLSLAALVAMGSMSVASATDLSEAIKGVDLGGYLRLRAYHDSKDANKNVAGDQSTRWRTTAAFKFAIPVDENLKFHTNFAFDWSIYNDGTNTGADTARPINVHMFADYKKDGASLILGKIPVNTPVTATGVGEAIAAGFVGTYKVGDALTVAAAGLDDLINVDQLKPLDNSTKGNNVYAAAAIYNSDIADIQAWYFNVDNTIDSDIVLMADIKALKDSGVTIHADYATASLTNTAETTFGVKGTQNYFNLSATFKQDALCAKAGYAVTGKDGGVVTLDGDSPLASVLGTEQQTGITDTTDNNALYANVSYKVDDKTSVKAAYSAVDAKSSNEFLVGANYAYTKKFNVYAYYSILSQNSKGQDNNEARLELKYKF